MFMDLLSKHGFSSSSVIQIKTHKYRKESINMNRRRNIKIKSQYIYVSVCIAVQNCEGFCGSQTSRWRKSREMEVKTCL